MILREVKIDGSKFFLNGKPVWIKGVNRHDTSPLNGRAVTTDEILSGCGDDETKQHQHRPHIPLPQR